jgi:hypothetical protein
MVRLWRHLPLTRQTAMTSGVIGGGVHRSRGRLQDVGIWCQGFSGQPLARAQDSARGSQVDLEAVLDGVELCVEEKCLHREGVHVRLPAAQAMTISAACVLRRSSRCLIRGSSDSASALIKTLAHLSSGSSTERQSTPLDLRRP